MSYRIAVACEDHTLDQYIIVPVLKSLLSHLGKPRAYVRVITDPRITGIDVLKAQASSILNRYAPLSDLVVFALDADGHDGQAGRKDRYLGFRESIKSHSYSEKAVVVAAQQEMEVWALWGSRSDIPEPWSEVLKENHPKECFFDPLTDRADKKKPGRGRQRLIEISLSQGWESIASGCPDLKRLEADVRAKMTGD